MKVVNNYLFINVLHSTNKNSTWYVDYEMWAEPLWPPCCFGPAYVMTPQAISKILEVHEAATNPFIPFEDIYVTGPK